MKMAKYIGKYKDLKNYDYGYNNHNYKQYSKPSGRCSSIINIWVKGNEIEYKDFYENSHYIFSFLKDLKLPKTKWMGRFLGVYQFNNKTGEIKVKGRKEREEGNEIYNKSDAEIDEYFRTYRDLIVGQDDINCVNELWDNNLIEISDR